MSDKCSYRLQLVLFNNHFDICRNIGHTGVDDDALAASCWRDDPAIGGKHWGWK